MIPLIPAAPAREIEMYSHLLLLHVLAATIWTGGHLVLATCILPRALRARDAAILLEFESRFEKIGMPALIVQVATGLWMAQQILPSHAGWFSTDSLQGRLILLKLALLLATVLTALDARLRLIPRLEAATLPALSRRIVLVTIIAVAFVVVGVSFRGGLIP